MGIVGFEEGWTAERTSLAIRLWKEGHSASQIAYKLGRVSRNAVIGKIHRLGLSGNRKEVSLQQKLNAKKAHKKAVKRSARGAPKRRTKLSRQMLSTQNGLIWTGTKFVSPGTLPDLRPIPLPQEQPEDIAQVASVADLEPHHCRWPIGDPKADFKGFCGAKKTQGEYCDHHHGRAHQGHWSRISSYDRQHLQAAE